MGIKRRQSDNFIHNTVTEIGNASRDWSFLFLSVGIISDANRSCRKSSVSRIELKSGRFRSKFYISQLSAPSSVELFLVVFYQNCFKNILLYNSNTLYFLSTGVIMIQF